VRIRAERDDLADVFARAARGVSPRTPLTILSGLLCSVKGNSLEVTGSDMEVTIRTQVGVEVHDEGQTVLPAKLIPDAVRKMPPGAVSIDVVEGEAVITGNGPTFRIHQFEPADFPELPVPDEPTTVEVGGGELADAIAQVASAASTDERRVALTGVYFDAADDGLRMIATDSYRMAFKKLPGVELPASALVPSRGLKELDRAVGAEKVAITLGDRYAGFSSERGSMTVRLIEAAFPDYRSLLDVGPVHNQVTVAKAALSEAVDRAALVADEHIPVRLHLVEGGVEVSIQRHDVGGERELIEAEYDGTEMQIAFNVRYLRDVIGALRGDNLVLDVQESNRPGLFHDGSDDFSYLVMPVKM